MLARPYHAPDTVAGQITKERAVRKLRTLKVFIISVLLLACCSWLMVSAALADDGGGGSHYFGGYGIIYGPTSTGTDDFGAHGYKVGCYAPNRYYAAYLLCSGNNANFDVVLTDEQKAYLSNASTGGGFYELAQKFVADAMPIYVLQYGEGNTWFAEYNNHDIDAAIEALRNVLNGGGSGSGGTGNVAPVPAGYTRYICKVPVSGAANMQIYDTEGNTWSNKYDAQYLLPQNLYVDIPDTLFTRLNAEYPEFSYRYIKVRNGGPSFSFEIIASDGQFTFDEATVELNGVTRNYYNKVYYTSGRRRFFGWKTFYTNNSTKYYTFDGTRIMLYDTSDDFGTGGSQNMSNESYGTTMAIGFVTDDTTPTVPPTNWPDTPDNPTPTEPDVPIHTGHGIDDLPEPNDYIEQPTYVTNVFTADLQGVIDALDEHCQHLQNAMYSNLQGFYDDITDFIWQVVQWLGSNINDMLNDLCDYLQDLFEWLANQFDYSVSGTGYNDNTVVSWLRKIYARLGGGTNTRPTDPVADPFDFGEWLAQLFGNFVGWLFGLGSEAVSGLVEDFQTLITKFPFSIPWDLGAMLALLVTAPVTPVFEFPCYTLSGSAITQVGTYRIDLSAWDDVMNTVRPMEVLVFAFWLAFKIDFFKGIIELNRN